MFPGSKRLLVWDEDPDPCSAGAAGIRDSTQGSPHLRGPSKLGSVYQARTGWPGASGTRSFEDQFGALARNFGSTAAKSPPTTLGAVLEEEPGASPSYCVLRVWVHGAGPATSIKPRRFFLINQLIYYN